MLYIAAVSLHYVHYSRKTEGVTDLVLAKTGCAWCTVEVWFVCVCVCAGGDECPGGGFSLDICPGGCVVMQVRFLGSGFSAGG